MKRILLLISLLFLVVLVTAGCDDDVFDQREEQLEATEEAAEDKGNSTPGSVCEALDPLEASVDVLEDMDPGEHSVEDYEAQFKVVRQDFDNLRAGDTEGLYTEDFDKFETALVEFEDGLTGLLAGEGGLLSGVLELASGAVDLAVAEEVLNEGIDCPGE